MAHPRRILSSTQSHSKREETSIGPAAQSDKAARISNAALRNSALQLTGCHLSNRRSNSPINEKAMGPRLVFGPSGSFAPESTSLSLGLGGDWRAQAGASHFKSAIRPRLRRRSSCHVKTAGAAPLFPCGKSGCPRCSNPVGAMLIAAALALSAAYPAATQAIQQKQIQLAVDHPIRLRGSFQRQ